jgi:hypothetical protein
LLALPETVLWLCVEALRVLKVMLSPIRLLALSALTEKLRFELLFAFYTLFPPTSNQNSSWMDLPLTEREQEPELQQDQQSVCQGA